MRLIDADALTDSLDNLCNMVCQYSIVQRIVMCGACPLGDAFDAIDNAPTVDATKHGHWIEVQRIHEKDHTAICECSLCGDTVWVYDGQRAWNYCPNCGAKMDEVENDNA